MNNAVDDERYGEIRRWRGILDMRRNASPFDASYALAHIIYARPKPFGRTAALSKLTSHNSPIPRLFAMHCRAGEGERERNHHITQPPLELSDIPAEPHLGVSAALFCICYETEGRV